MEVDRTDTLIDQGLAIADEEVVGDHAACRGNGGPGSVAQPDNERLPAIDDRVEGHHRASSRNVAREGRVRQAVHQRERHAGVGPLQVGEVIIEHAMPFADDSDPAGTLGLLAKEDVTLDHAVVAVPKRRGP